MQPGKALRYAVIALLAAAVIVFVYFNRVRLGRIVSPFFIAVIIAYIVNPFTERLQRRKVHKTTAILLVYAFFTGLIVSVVYFLVPEMAKNAADLANTLPEIANRYQSVINGFISSIKNSGWSNDVKTLVLSEIGSITSMIQNTAAGVLDRVMSSIGGIVTFLFDFSLALVVAYYFIKDKEFFKSAAMSLTPKKYRGIVEKVGKDINQVLTSFLYGQLIAALAVGVLESVGLLIAGVKYPLILGMFGGFANIIPYFGPYIGAIPAVALSLIESPVKAIWTVLIFVIVQQIDNSFISPKVIEHRLGLHPITTLAAVLVGQHFFGLVGMFASVPVVAIIKVVFRRVVDTVA